MSKVKAKQDLVGQETYKELESRHLLESNHILVLLLFQHFLVCFYIFTDLCSMYPLNLILEFTVVHCIAFILF